MIATVAEETSSTAVIAPGVVASSPRATATMNPTHDNPSKNENSIPRTHTVDVEDAPSNQVNSLDKTENNNGSSYLYLGFLLLTKFWLVTTIWIYKYLLQLADVMTFVVGYLTKLVPVDDISKWISETIPPWLEVILFQSSSPHNALKGSNSDHAWPPPALKALALLTIVALVIHPDGLTWVFLGKLRYVLRMQNQVHAYFFICFDGRLTVFMFAFVPYGIVRLRMVSCFGSFSTVIRYMLSFRYWEILWSFS